MQNKRPRSLHPKKFRLLLDSAFAKPDVFTKLRKKANVLHTVHDLGLPYQVEDEEIYQRAIQENRFVVTINFDDFKNFVKPGKPGIIGIPSQLTNADIDALLTKFLTVNTVEDCLGKAIKLSITEL